MTDRGEATGYTQTVTLRPCSVGEVCGTGTLVGKLRSGGAAITCDGTMELVDVRVLTERNDVMGGKLTFIFLENATAFTGPWRGCSSGILSYYQPNADGTALWMRVFNGDAPTAWGNLYRVDASQAPAASN